MTEKIEFQWDTEIANVLVVVFHNTWDWTDYTAAIMKNTDWVLEKGMRYDQILDFGQCLTIPKGSASRHIEKGQQRGPEIPANGGHTWYVGRATHIRMMLKIFGVQFNQGLFDKRVVADMATARRAITIHRNEADTTHL